jgi:DNA-binding IscR family transcriptional regulator
VAVTACSTDETGCDQFAKCNVRDPLWRVRERILSALADCTIAELASDAPLVVTARTVALHTSL